MPIFIPFAPYLLSARESACLTRWWTLTGGPSESSRKCEPLFFDNPTAGSGGFQRTWYIESGKTTCFSNMVVCFEVKMGSQFRELPCLLVCDDLLTETCKTLILFFQNTLPHSLSPLQAPAASCKILSARSPLQQAKILKNYFFFFFFLQFDLARFFLKARASRKLMYRFWSKYIFGESQSP